MGRLKLRTFIALPLDDAVRRRIVVLQQDLGEAGGEVKWVEPENLHVTLLFLGEVDALEVVEICRAVRGVAGATESFTLAAAGVGAFPNLRRPRTLWVGAEEGRDELVALHDKLEEALLTLGAYRREERGFTPHITLGRVNGDAPPALHEALKREGDWQGGAQQMRAVHVMSSELTPDGPCYNVVSREKLRVV
jgi:RNA 2',3'-cyclic 3'-phosphodiesterase